MKVLAYTGTGEQVTGNGWMPVTLPMSFNMQDSTGAQADLEKDFGIVMDPSGRCAVVNNSGRNVHLMLTMSAHVAGNNMWREPLSLGVFNQLIDGVYGVKEMVASADLSYQNTLGNVVVMHAILPVLLAGQSFYFGVGSYRPFNLLDLTLRFCEMGQ